MKRFSIYLCGVGGQGIGLLSEVLLRAADHAGLAVKAVDTHGLAQRGGIVVSQIRIGDTVHSPLICEQQADLVVSLERHEALRAVTRYVRDGGTLIYYNTVWQPLGVRLGSMRKSRQMLSKRIAAIAVSGSSPFSSRLFRRPVCKTWCCWHASPVKTLSRGSRPLTTCWPWKI
jgi:Pyruvate/2-oxoacid:ferredoxin oxidoreductase gamma subunit